MAEAKDTTQFYQLQSYSNEVFIQQNDENALTNYLSKGDNYLTLPKYTIRGT